MEFDVTKDRDKYVGGSDMPIIFGISPFKTRWQLLLEKAEPVADNMPRQMTNDAIEYGNTMEPKIRDFINFEYNSAFVPDQKIDGNLRANVDGWDADKQMILEIKTTSVTHQYLLEYKYYLVQLLFYMKIYGVERGLLAVYERPDDYNEEFDMERLHIFPVYLSQHEALCEEIDFQVERFLCDLERVKSNPLLTEQDLQPNEVILAAQWVMGLEQQLIGMKHFEQELKSAKAELKRAMEAHGIKRWITNGGVKVTLVEGSEDSVVRELDIKRFADEQPQMYEDYLVDKVKKGRSGYVLVTPPRN